MAIGVDLTAGASGAVSVGVASGSTDLVGVGAMRDLGPISSSVSSGVCAVIGVIRSEGMRAPAVAKLISSAGRIRQTRGPSLGYRCWARIKF